MLGMFWIGLIMYGQRSIQKGLKDGMFYTLI